MRLRRLLFALLIIPVLVTGCVSARADAAADRHAVDPASSPQWAQDMARFAAEDAAHPPPAHPVVFTGSSSIRMWTSLAGDFPGLPVLNRGFGGSQIRDLVWYADDVAMRYRPRRIVVYSGDNDIDAGRSPEQVLADFRAFVACVRRDLPDVPIDVLSIKPSLARVDQLPRQRRANALVEAAAARMRHVGYIDVATPMLGADGKPRPELFGDDGLHMNARGYALWTKIVGARLSPAAAPRR